jgi:hypothetical protein
VESRITIGRPGAATQIPRAVAVKLSPLAESVVRFTVKPELAFAIV